MDTTGAMEKGGVGALELVAMDMKARFLLGYLCLSYQASLSLYY